ncbi:hypothetical protein QD47_24280 [Paenibacillus terrae]|uniref:Uncharacterized protein n=1 Tax=Paenibacillus terrae TaxID=159743 RepID=A0A0D7WVE7_9BACL|nr:hypothetical protein QD47_24280 [Paenibacillus terrae]
MTYARSELFTNRSQYDILVMGGKWNGKEPLDKGKGLVLLKYIRGSRMVNSPLISMVVFIFLLY